MEIMRVLIASGLAAVTHTHTAHTAFIAVGLSQSAWFVVVT